MSTKASRTFMFNFIAEQQVTHKETEADPPAT